MRETFDALTRFATRLPLAKYPEDKWESITACLATAGPTLYPTASDAAWEGWTQYGINGGQPGDEWNANMSSAYQEYEPRNLTFRGQHFPVVEPCNTLSNFAYYRIIPDLCSNRESLAMTDEYINAVIQSFATLGMGSSFMHGSRTLLGCTFDNVPIGVMAYEFLQWMNAPLKAGVNGTESVLQELSPTPRAYDGRTLATKLHTIPLDFELNDWNDALMQLDLPDYFFTFGGIVINCFTLLAPNSVTDAVIPPLIALFGLLPDAQKFLTETYVETIRGAVDFKLTLAQKKELLPKFIGTLLKLFYAFVWQEHTFIYSFVFNPLWNTFGDYLIKPVFSLANKLTKFPHDDLDFQKGTAIYPGQEHCNAKATAPHAKWHEVSANGLVDLAYLSDAVHVAIEKAQAPGIEESFDTTGDEVFMTADIFEEWAAETHAIRSEAHFVRQAFSAVVMDIVNEMDECGSGPADGSITWDELACYVASMDAHHFVQKIFDGISARYTPEDIVV